MVTTCVPATIAPRSIGLPPSGREREPGQRRVLIGVVRRLERARVGERSFRKVAGHALEPDGERAAERDRHRLELAAGGVGIARARRRLAGERLGNVGTEHAAGIGRDRDRRPDCRRRSGGAAGARRSPARRRGSPTAAWAYGRGSTPSPSNRAVARRDRRSTTASSIMVAPGATSGGSAFQPTMVRLGRSSHGTVVERRRAAGARRRRCSASTTAGAQSRACRVGAEVDHDSILTPSSTSNGGPVRYADDV